MKVQMRHGLPSFFPGVDHGPISGSRDSLLSRQRHRQHHHLPESLPVAEIVQRINVLLRNYEHVDGRLGRAIAECKTIAGACDDVSGNLSANDPAENALLSHLEN
jgi:hypothetical protein